MSKRHLAIFTLAILLASSALVAAEVQLKALTLPSGSQIDINFAKTSRAPSGAAMQATLLYDNGRTSVKLSYQKMEPAVLFAGDISAYVLWAVTIDGSAENLGEVVADKKSASGTLQGYTGKRVFALMVTAEPFATVTQPTEVVLFVSGEIRGKNVLSTPFSFTNFSTSYRPALDSISGIQYKDSVPVAVKQAKKALEIAETINAAEVNPKAVSGAQAAFAKAQASAGDKKVMADQARIAAQLASQAIKDTIEANEAEAAADAEAKRLAEKAALEQRATTAEGESQRIAQELKEVRVQREALASETQNLARLAEKLAAEKDAIAADRDAVKAEWDKVVADREAIKIEAKRLAEKAALEQRAIAAEGEPQPIAQELKEVQAQREALASETRNLTLLTDKLAAEKNAIAADREAIKAEAKAAADVEAKRLAEKAALEQRATTAEGESQRIAQQLKDVQIQREALASETKNLARLTEKLTAEKDAIAADRDAVKAERDKVAADREAMKAEAKAAAEAEKLTVEKNAIAAEKERDDLVGKLKDALSSVAETTETTRGVIVSLSGLFDVGKTTLKPASQVSVAKLAGIIKVFTNMNLSIEGYTDSSGSSDLNMKLSAARARSVYEFLMGQGISNGRMKYQGFGPDNPVAPNDTEINRAKNRRIEVVLTQAVKAP
jgi:outer membrane protein OmpA-like peptidoglycan-associated protein